jgi:hypothetical protein
MNTPYLFCPQDRKEVFSDREVQKNVVNLSLAAYVARNLTTVWPFFTRSYSKETERLGESPNSSLGDSAYVIQWRFSEGATGAPPVAPSEKRCQATV